jgi:hypothetical protein
LFQIIEKFFDTRAAAPPYKPNALSGFGRMLNVPCNVLKDFIQIMKLELVGEYMKMYTYSKFTFVVSFYAFIVVQLKSPFLWDVASHHWVIGTQCFNSV